MTRDGGYPHQDDLAWAAALARGDRAALLRYEQEIVPVVAATLASRGHGADEIDELQQVLRERMFVSADGSPPAIASFAGRGPLRAWVMITAIREALRRRQRAMRETAVDDDALMALLESTTREPPGHADKAPYREAFRVAFRAALAGLSPRERTLLRLSVLDGLSIDQIGALHGVHRATAARWLEKARETVARGVRHELMRLLATDRFETEDLLAWVQSAVELSLGGLATSS